MPNTPLNKEQLKEKLSIFSGQGAHACYCERSTDGGCTCALKDEHVEDLVKELLADRNAAVREAELKAEIRIHDEYWHSQRLVDDNGIGPVALANKEATELELRKLQSQPNAKEGE